MCGTEGGSVSVTAYETSYETSPIKRNRRSAEQIAVMLRAVQTIIDGEEDKITIRHLYYRLVGLGVIPKTEAAYKGLCSHLSKWRRSGEIEFSAFIDSTRWHIKSRTFDSIDDALEETVSSYRRNLWATQPFYLETWVEKDAIASIVSDVADEFGVPTFVARGFASLSSLYDAADTFREANQAGKQCIIYQFGDHDPSGVAAAQSIQSAFRDDFGVDVELIRSAVTPEQIESFRLPTRPTKSSDSRSRNWTGGDSVEIDTMPTAEIKRLVEASIVQNIDVREWQAIKRTEAMERETLAQMRDSA